MFAVLLLLFTAAFVPEAPRQRAVASVSLPATLRRADRALAGAPVETEMRHVWYRSAPNAPITIHYLRGALHPARPGEAPWLEDRTSFTVAIDTAFLSVDGAALAAIMNDHVLNYEGAPLSALRIAVRPDGLEIKGRLRGLGFTMLADASVTADGRLRLRHRAVKVAGIGVRSLMRRLGIELDDVMRVRQGRGVEVSEDDIILTPGDVVPPPRLDGRLVASSLRGGKLQLFFGRPARGAAPPLDHPGPPGVNYVCYHGGVLRFGKLIMPDTDLEIVDADPRDPFDLSLVEFNRQLVAGFSRNQPDFGLRTTMPDYGDLPAVSSRGR